MKKHLLLSLSSAMLVGCSQIEDAPPTPDVGGNDAIAMVAVADTSSMVTLDNIQQIIASASAQSRAARTVKEIRPITGANGDTLLYVVNYTDDHGFDIVSASKKYNPLLATADEGNFPIDTDDTAIGLWIQGQCDAIENIDQIPDSLRNSWRIAWERATAKKCQFNMKSQSRFLDEFDDYTIDYVTQRIAQWNAEGYTVYTLADFKNTYDYNILSFTDRNAIDNIVQNYTWPYAQDRDELCFMVCENSTTDINVPNFVNVKWGQNNGFDRYTPIDPNSGRHCPVGCVPVAIGQILRHYEHPLPNRVINWTAMNRYSATDAAARFLADIGQTIGVNYGINGSGATIQQAKNGLVNSFGCTQAKNADINYEIVRNQLNQNHPVMVGGISYDPNTDNDIRHFWLYTGYTYYQYHQKRWLYVLSSFPGDAPLLLSWWQRTDDYNPTFRLYCNWGYQGYGDGMFDYTLQYTPEYVYTPSKMIYDIFFP